jgi:hypothetical protein
MDSYKKESSISDLGYQEQEAIEVLKNAYDSIGSADIEFVLGTISRIISLINRYYSDDIERKNNFETI